MLSLSSHCRFLVSVKFTGNGVNRTVMGAKGESLLHIAEKNEIKIPNACEGSCACGTCQVYVIKGAELLNEASEQENDTLDFAIDVRDNSRLACSAIIKEDNGEIEAEIPRHSRNII